MYCSPVQELLHIVTENRTHRLCIGGQLVVPLWYQCVVLLDFEKEISLFIERTDYRSNLAKTILFENLFLFFENTFQYLGGISQDISVSHFDSRRSQSSANRRQIVGDLPDRFFLSALLSLVISMTGDPNDPQERCAMARTSCARL